VDAKKLKKLITAIENEDVMVDLYSYAIHMGNRKLPPGVEPDDIVHDIILDVSEGRRNWDDNQYPDIIVVLKGMIRSKIYGVRTAKAVRCRDSRPFDEVLESTGEQSDGAEKIINDIALGEIITLIEKAIGDDLELMEIYHIILDGSTKPKEIADLTGITVQEVNKRLSRLRYNCNKIVRKEARQ
jgi:transcription initiation factor IIE alpha subunit